jgi:hypothetical protein
MEQRSQARWFTPVIPATWEVEIRRIEVPSHLSKKLVETPFSTNKPGVWCVPVFPAMQEAVDGRIAVQAALEKT